MRLDRRSIHALALVAWAGVFAWLWLTGESVRYLGPRTQWVVPVGAIGLTLAAGGYLLATRADVPARLSLREALGLAGLVVPVLAAAVLANAQLGALAASNKLSSRGIDSSALARLASRDAKHIGFLQLNAAGRDDGLTRELGLAEGRSVQLTGFISKTGRPFTLSRFYITCCVADAVPIGVRVLPRGKAAGLDRGDWIDVTGVLARGHREWIVRALELKHVQPPSDPYLSFAG
ncbi:MAG: putative rane protein [Thermoleophilaceae bacterium]|jgi:putative membrane protein|nr:putative rane protein [Thermoleophilaceae bacterium]